MSRSTCMIDSVRARLLTAAVSVSSKQIRSGGMLEATHALSIMPMSESSLIDCADRLIEKRAIRLVNSSRCLASAAKVLLTTHSSIAGIIW